MFCLRAILFPAFASSSHYQGWGSNIYRSASNTRIPPQISSQWYARVARIISMINRLSPLLVTLEQALKQDK